MLVEKAEAWAQGEGATGVELTVYEFNQGAREMYEALGYQTGRRRMGKSLD